MSLEPGRTAADVMITQVKTLPDCACIAQVRDQFADDHVHMVLLVRAGVLHGTLLRSDLPADLPSGSSAVGVSTLAGRTAAPGDDMERIRRTMAQHGLRRLAVIDERRRLLGLVCLKRSATGFCDDAGVAARRRERVPSGALQFGRGLQGIRR